MTTDQPNGRALDEAAARAMGWTIITDCNWVWFCNPEQQSGRKEGPTERDMLAWLHERGSGAGLVTTRTINKTARASLCIAPDWVEPVASSEGTDLREALARLVVAVKQREDAK